MKRKRYTARRPWFTACFVGLLVGAASVAALHAYSEIDRYAFLSPTLPTDIPFSLTHAGTKASIDFWILPGLDKLGERKTLSLAFEGDNEGLIDELRRVRLAVKARVFFMRNRERLPLIVQDFEDSMWIFYPRQFAAPTLEKMRDEMAFVRELGGDGYREDVMIVKFYPTHYGHDVAEVETVTDEPSLAGRTVKLVVGQLSWGK